MIQLFSVGSYLKKSTGSYRVMSSFALVNSWRSFAATARQIAVQDGVAANKCGRTTHIVATDMWSDDITYYIILYGLKIMKRTMDRRTNERTDGRMEGERRTQPLIESLVVTKILATMSCTDICKSSCGNSH